MQQPKNTIQIGVGQKDCGNGRVAKSGNRCEFWIFNQLVPQVWRGVEKYPFTRTRRNGNLRLGARLTLKSAGAQAAAIGATAIPLRKATPGGRAEDLNAH